MTAVEKHELKEKLKSSIIERERKIGENASIDNNLKKSPYFVNCVVNEIGRLAFLMDADFTMSDQEELIEWFWSGKDR